MYINFPFKDNYNVDDLLQIMKILRSPEGCPWDKEQNHKSIRENFLEEVYEVLETIDKNDSLAMCEELGDVLLQIIFHCQMALEKWGKP